MLPNQDELLITALNQILSLCEAVGLPFKTVNLDDPVCQKGYLIVLKANRITPTILNAATPQIIGMDRFPTPGHIVEKCLPYRAEAESNRMKDWIVAVDPRLGVELVAPPTSVHDGVYRPGRSDNNGLPAPVSPALPLPESEKAALMERLSRPLPLPVADPAREYDGIAPEVEDNLIRAAREWNALTPDEKARRKA